MKDQVYVQDLAEHVGKTVTIYGWVHNKRSSGRVHFLMIRDGTGYIQAIISKQAVPLVLFKSTLELTHESSVKVTGTVSADQRAPGGFEIAVTNLEVVQLVPKDDPFPITPKEHGIDFKMDYRHLWVRSMRQWAILRIRHEIHKAIRGFLDEKGFVETDTPILTPAACEGTTTLFEVEYFEDKAYLTQSGQLYLEALAMAFGKVYAFGPTFRAEKSKTRRHLTEFWMAEVEVAFATIDDLMDLAEELITYIVKEVLKNRQEELRILGRDTEKLSLISTPFPRISYDEAVQMIQDHGLEFQWGGDFGSGDETILSECFDRPVMVYRLPTAIKAFYQEPDPNRPEVVLAVDVLAPEGYGEIIGGGQRMNGYELLVQRLKEHDLPREAFEWYLDQRKYGSVPHSGFGMGLERLVTWICGLEHVREAIPFPRMLYRLKP